MKHLMIAFIASFAISATACSDDPNNGDDDGSPTSDAGDSGNTGDDAENTDGTSDGDAIDGDTNAGETDDDVGEGIAPIVVTVFPRQDATDVATNTSVDVKFSELMDASTLERDALAVEDMTFTLSDGVDAVPSEVTYAGYIAKLKPSERLETNTVYTVTMTTAATSQAGTALADAKVWSFTTSSIDATGQQAVNLGDAEDYVILAKSGISTTGTTAIVGDIGLSPAAASYITGFDLLSPATTFTTSSAVAGKVWSVSFDEPTPTNLGVGVLDMENAYTDAAGRTLPDHTELGAGNIDGMTLEPGLYKWGTGVLIPTGVTLEGSATDVWIFQIAENLTVENGAIITLAGGAKAENIFWQVAGEATLGTTAEVKGIIMSKTLIEMKTGATLSGRAFAQTAVTLDAAAVTQP